MELKDFLEEERSFGKEEFIELVNRVIEILEKERKRDLVVIKPKGLLIVVGDLHGDLASLCFILEKSKFLERNDKIIFLGDYGDRGEYSPQIYFLILKLKEKFPKRVFLLRGNHEFLEGLEIYPHDLPFQIIKRYGSSEVYEKVKEFWSYLYFSALVKKKYLFLHGGLPVNLSSVKELEKVSKESAEEILWNDPAEIKGFFPSSRGAGKIFGEDVSKRILKVLEVKTVIRSHEPSLKVNHSGLVLTLTSTKVYGNFASYLKINLEERAKDAFELEKEVIKF